MALRTHDAFSLRGLAAGCALLLLVAPAVQAAEQLPDAPSIDARAWILMDYASGKVLSEGNADEKLDPASLTKIMTSYVVGQALKAGKIKSTDMVTIGRDAWATGNPALRGSSVMFLKPGMQVSVEDLNKGVIIQSGNDASIAIADYVAVSQDAFVSLMNGYAQKMGLTNTTFMTVHGLDAPGQFSTARDMALLTKAMIHDVPEEYAIHKEKEFTFNKIRQPNRNRLLWDQSLQVDGIKTGHVSQVGYNLVSSATNNEGMRLIAVVLGASSEASRAAESKKLLTYGFRFFQSLTPYKAGTELVTQKIWMGDKPEVKLGVDKDVSVLVTRGQGNNLKADFQLDSELKAPLSMGQRVGTVFLKQGDKEIKQVPLVALEEVQEGGLMSRLWDYLVLLVTSWFK